jgi:BirA family biotin operon repressor/biotin-[acetyl-CoA-carboxylase] ligase
MNERILKVFMEQQDQYVSGEHLSQLLNCSRTAVWKHIQQLKQEGYSFESVPRKGYRLMEKPERINAAALSLACAQVGLVRRICFYDSLSSTQTEAHRLVAEGAGHGTLVVAEAQTSGRGRRGRHWLSPPGKGIWMSLVITPSITLPLAPQITLLTAVALCRTIRKVIQVDVGIKWPNDLLIYGKKISGILVESSGEDERIRYMVIGVGIGCNLELEDYPLELQDIATSLYITSGKKVDRIQLLQSFLLEFGAMYDLYLDKGFDPIRTLWETLSVSLGRQIRFQDGSDWLEGEAMSIDDRGALLVRRSDGSSVAVFSGDSQA